MKRLYIFLAFILIIIGLYVYFINRVRSYEIEYKVDGFKVIETYHKEDKYYSFLLSKDDVTFNFAYESKYSNKRKLVEKINIKEKDDILCVKPKVSKMKFDYTCYDGEYKSPYVLGIIKNEESKKINSYNNINIYSKDYDYYVWNGHGITNILTKKEFNFLDNEQYDNNLAYQVDGYIIFANYNQKREFDSFYVFNYKKEKLQKWEIGYEIDFDAFFMGDVDGYIYLFDRKNAVQYKIDVINKDISVSSDNEGALYFDGEWTSKPLKELKYKDYVMEDDKLYNFLLKNNKLYLNIDKSKQDILLTNHKILSIVFESYDSVFYLVEDDIYAYVIGKGEYKILDYFEWNFSYQNKIYIFN